jgi:hypothetical protein
MIQTAEKKLVIKAIDELGRSVTAADIASKTGLPILFATSELNKVASETNGHLEVSTAGNIAYKFNPGFQTSYLAKGIQLQFEKIGQKIFEIGYLILKASFGIMLLLSFIIVVLLIIAAMFAGKGDRDGDGPGGFDLDFIDFMIFRDLLWWGSFSTYPNYVDYSTPAVVKPRGKGNFLTKCLSFLFGDGDPNAHLEERKWQMVAQAIRNHGGVVTAEQLAPYTGADPTNEDGALPALVRFNGTPEVTDDGHILYTFPSLQVSASGLNLSGKLPPYLREFRREFSVYDGEELTSVYILSGANLLGGMWLWGQSTQTEHITILNSFHGLICWLVAYGVFFVAVPAVRWLVLMSINSKIESRNDKREKNALLLKNPSADLQKKLSQAAQFSASKRLEWKPDTHVVYSTDKDLLEQEFDK